MDTMKRKKKQVVPMVECDERKEVLNDDVRTSGRLIPDEMSFHKFK